MIHAEGDGMRCCGSCDYYNALSGQCRKNPPTVMALMPAPGQLQITGAFPPVRDSDWCGAFFPSNPDKAEAQ